MTRLQILNRRMQELEHNGDISEEEYATYKYLLRGVEVLTLIRDRLSADYGFDYAEMRSQDFEDADDYLERLE